MQKRVSKRRWKRRARAGRVIPLAAIVDYQLDKWFVFSTASNLTETYRVESIIARAAS
jgi:hypothetical protein